MAAVEPAQRAQELQFLLRMLTQSKAADLPPEPYTSARSYPPANWYRSAISPSWATALNLTMGVMGPKVGGPKVAVPEVPLTPLSEFKGTPASELVQPGQPGSIGGQRAVMDVENDPPIPSEMLNPATGKYEAIPRRGTPITATPEEILRRTIEDKGYTVNLETGEVPKTGIMAGKFANADPRTRVINGDPTMVDITDWIKQNEKILKGSVAEKQGLHAGTWQDEKTGKTYLDVSKRFEPTQIRPATKFGEKTGQISLYNVGLPKDDPMKYPPVGSYPKYVSGEFTPEGVVPYAQRLQEMGRFGQRYMRDQPLREWWRTPYLESIYGPGRMQQMKGFLAATSTNTKPRPNVQMASEYMRRAIKGEPMVQSDWRAPPTAMGGAVNPGSAMGLETGKGGREFNLEAAARGDLAAMRGPVVREKLQALGGDPSAIVLDRIQARLTEAPKAGIYAESKEGVSPTGANRQLVKDAITKQAQAAKADPDTFSANVWAGIREWVKRTGDLYGTPMERTQAGTRSTESSSYDDQARELVASKAKHLGISVPEMEAKLKAGSVELLSYLLATPIGAELYRRSRGAQ